MTQMILGLHAHTSIHAGVGQALGVVDLPIQREAHTGYPCIYGSGIKGAIRAKAELGSKMPKSVITQVFGPEQTGGGGEQAGAVAFSDAKLVLLPVRSLTSQFKWVTCPYALHRYQVDAKRVGLKVDFPALSIAKATNNISSAIGHKKENVFLEEYRFEANKTINLEPIVSALKKLMKPEMQPFLDEQLLIVDDNMFAHLAQHVTPVNAHIAIETERKMVRTGALWYEETLPPESVLYVVVHANASREKLKENESRAGAEVMLSAVKELFADNWLQVGGNETVGMGWCQVNLLEKTGG